MGSWSGVRRAVTALLLSGATACGDNAVAPVDDAPPPPPDAAMVADAAPADASRDAPADAAPDASPDAALGLHVDVVPVALEEAAGAIALIPIVLSEPSDADVSVRVTSEPGTALAGTDFVAVDQVVTFAPGEVSALVPLPIVDDAVAELTETLQIELSDVVGAALPPMPFAAVTIADSADLPVLTIDDVAVAEGDVGITVATVALHLSAPAPAEVAVTYATADDSAGAPADYVAASGTVQFAPGEVAGTIELAVHGDAVIEGADVFHVLLAESVLATIGDAQADVTILNDDASDADLAVDDPVVADGDAGTSTNLTFTVTMSAPQVQPVTIQYRTIDGTATALTTSSPGGEDFEATAGTLTFAPGQVSKTVVVTVTGDAIDEPDETLGLELFDASGVGAPDSVGVALIVDDDEPPALSVDDAAALEGDAGGSTLSFVLQLSAPSSQPVAIEYATHAATADLFGATALGLGDYASATGVAVFAPGETAQGLDVIVRGDDVDEADDVVELWLLDDTAVGATVADGIGHGVILDDDLPPEVNIGPASASVRELATASATLRYTVSLSGPSSHVVEVPVATVAGGGLAPATSGVDFTALAQIVTFAPGTISAEVVVEVLPDAIAEPPESFAIQLGAPTHATLGPATSSDARIDDVSAQAAVFEVRSSPLPQEDAGVITFEIVRSGEPIPATINFATAAGGSATPGVDFVPTSGSVVFTAATSSRTFTVPLINDDRCELHSELMVVDLALVPTPGAALRGDRAGAYIQDDDPLPTLTLSQTSAAIYEGNVSAPSAAVHFGLSFPCDHSLGAYVAFQAGTAVPGSDYLAPPGITWVSFPPGSVDTSAAFTVVGDTTPEPAETFDVEWVNPFAGPADMVLGTTEVTIIDDDAIPALSVADVQIFEGNAGTRQLTFTLVLSSATSNTVTMNLSTVAQSASSPSDYVARVMVPVSFPPLTTSQTFAVTIKGDTQVELHEYFVLRIDNLVGATGPMMQIRGLIKNDD